MNKDKFIDQNDRLWLGDIDGAPILEDLVKSLDEILTDLLPEEDYARALAGLQQELDDHFGPVVYYDDIPESQIGRIFTAVTNGGVVAIEFDITLDKFIQRNKKRGYRRFHQSAAHTASARQQNIDYLNGNLVEFDLPSDLTGLTEFQREVLSAACEIPRARLRPTAKLPTLWADQNRRGPWDAR